MLNEIAQRKLNICLKIVHSAFLQSREKSCRDASFYVRGIYGGSTEELVHSCILAVLFFKFMWLFIPEIKENRKEILIFSFGYLKGKQNTSFKRKRKLYLFSPQVGSQRQPCQLFQMFGPTTRKQHFVFKVQS